MTENRRRTPQDSREAEAASAAKRRSVGLNAGVIASLLLAAPGLWFAITQKANFRLGGTDGGTGTRRGTFVNATGLDAIAIGFVFIGLAVINLALGIRSRRRIPVFWLGAVLFLAPVLYGLGKFALDVYQFISDVRAS